jgi:adenylate cyclase
LSAAHRAIADLRNLNLAPPAGLAPIDGWRPMQAGIALHEGEVFFGNIGSSGRLDFTVIGPAVNEAFRVEALQKSLGREIILTEAVARLLDSRLELLGEHQLRGVAAPMSVYSPN